jgi:hypothetical protein
MDARWHSSSPIMGLMPVSFIYRAFLTGAGAAAIRSAKPSRETVKGSPLCSVRGIK